MERARREPKGLAGWLGKVSGVNAVRRQVQRYRDRKRLEEFRAERQELREAQAREREALKQKQILEKRDLERQSRALTKLENKERRTLERRLARQHRVSLRRGRPRMPAIKREPGQDISQAGALSIQMNTASGARSKVRRRGELKKQFGHVAGNRAGQRDDEDRVTDAGYDPREAPKRRRYRRRRDRDRGHER